MTTVLIIAPNAALAEKLSSELSADRFKIVHRTDVEDAEPVLVRGLAQACLLDADLQGVQDLWLLDKISPLIGRGVLIVCSNSPTTEWQNQAYLRGVTHVLPKLPSGRVLEAILAREGEVSAAPAVAAVPPVELAPVAPLAAAAFQSPAPALNLLRDFSTVLTHSHNTDELLKQLLVLMRQILALNRGAIFLRPPIGAAVEAPSSVEVPLLPVTSVGLPPEVVARAQLSLDSGLGALLQRAGRILRVGSEELRADVAALHEFHLLSARVAVPILDRGTLLGVALLDGRVTGEPLQNPELELIFHLLEQAGLAIRNLWLQAQQAANHDLLAGVLRELSSACVVVDRDHRVRHANKMALKHFGAGRQGTLEFTDLPSELGRKIYQVIKTGAGLLPFRFTSDRNPSLVFQVTIVPFQRNADGAPASVLMTAEDQTQNEQLRRLEMEASDLRMVKNMAHRLVAETANAIVPLNAFVQFPPDAMDRSMLDTMLPALRDTDKRIERRVRQFRYLAEDAIEAGDQLTLAPLLEKAFAEAQHYHPVDKAQLILENAASTATFPANRERLQFAIAEVLMNATRANIDHPVVKVRRVEAESGFSGPMLAFEIHDQGTGFSREDFEKAGKHFFTTRVPGLGLGLAVARKIIEAHGGKLELGPPGAGSHGWVRVQLPLAVPDHA